MVILLINIERFVIFHFSWSSAKSLMMIAKIESGPMVDCDGTWKRCRDGFRGARGKGAVWAT